MSWGRQLIQGERPWEPAEHYPKAHEKFCSFGISELIGTFLATDLGVGTATAGALGSGITGAGVGALGSAITGGNPLTGALTGGLTGGLTAGFGGDVASGLGIGTGAADALIGAGSGLLSSAVTGGNPLTGALEGGIGGYLAAPSGATTSAATPATGLAGGGSSAASSGLPGGASLSATGGGLPDLTSSFNGSPIPGLPNTEGLLPFGDQAGGAAGGFSGGAVPGGGFPSGSPTDSFSLGTSAPIGTVQAPNISPNIGSVSGATPALPTTSGGVGGILKDLGINSTGQGIAAGADLLGIIQGQQQMGALNSTLKNLSTQAGQQSQAALNLESSLATGQLPPGAQAAVDQATKAAKAQISSKYASLGLSGSTMEAQDLANVDQQAAAQVFGLAKQLYDTGVSQTQLSNQLYQAILSAQGTLANETNNALLGFSSAISGSPYAPKAA